MKKMVPLIIFLAVLVVLCLAGCARFSTVLSGDTTTEAEITAAENAETQAQTEGQTDIVALDVPVTDAQGEIITDAQGNWETTREYYEIPVTEATTAATITETTTVQTAPVQEGTTAVAPTQPYEGIETSAPTEETTAVSVPTGATEYDLLRSGNFYMQGTMFDGSETLPLEVAITPNTIYMTSEMDGISVGILVDPAKKVYMMIPQKKIYLELSDAVMKYMGVSADDLVSSDSVDFSKYKPLSEADSSSEVILNGVTCQEYIFNEATGQTRVYISGTKLLRFASYSASGSLLTASDLTSITGTVPAEKSSAPSSYKGYSGITGLIGFMSQMADLME